MFRASFPIGKIMGVALRLHASFPILLGLALIYSEIVTGSALRGIGLCFALLFAVAVREISRALAAAYRGLELRAVVIFPVGGIMAFANAGEGIAASTRLVTLIAPFANLITGALLLGLSYGIDPGVRLFDDPWISPSFILRSVVWTQFVLAAVSLLPAAAISMRKLMPRRQKAQGATTRVLSINFSMLIAFAFLVAGLIQHNVWLSLFGTFMFLAAMLRSSAPLESLAGTTLVREALQTEFTVISSSDTLRSALQTSVGSKDEIFPVVRGDRLVGSISRDTLTNHLASDGDSYVQGSMTRTLALASPEENLATVLRRTGSAELIAVFDGNALLGILNQQGVLRAVQRLSLLRSLNVEDPGL